jgi:hypothetical protein
VLDARTGDLRGAVRVGLRPADIALSLTRSGRPNEIGGRVIDEIFLGEHVQLRIELRPGLVIEARLAKRAPEPWRQRDVYSWLAADDILIFRAD